MQGVCVVVPNHAVTQVMAHRNLLENSRSFHAGRQEGVHNGQPDPNGREGALSAP